MRSIRCGEFWRRDALAAIAVILTVLMAASACASAAPPASRWTSVPVHRGSVAQKASATGALSGVAPSGPGSVVVAPFEEAEAAQVRAGQPAQVSFDAVPGLVRSGSVLAVAPQAVSISGVTNYYITIVLTDSDPRLRSGQTAQVSVTTASVHNVLVVPSSAVVMADGRTYVNVAGPGGEPVRVPFVAGARDARSTQVVSGLSAGQPVLVPESR